MISEIGSLRTCVCVDVTFSSVCLTMILYHFLFVDSVKPTDGKETTDTLWGEGKADPKTTLEENDFLMKKMILSAAQGQRLRGRGRGRRYGNNKSKGETMAVIEA